MNSPEKTNWNGPRMEGFIMMYFNINLIKSIEKSTEYIKKKKKIMKNVDIISSHVWFHNIWDKIIHNAIY